MEVQLAASLVLVAVFSAALSWYVVRYKLSIRGTFIRLMSFLLLSAGVFTVGFLGLVLAV